MPTTPVRDSRRSRPRTAVRPALRSRTSYDSAQPDLDRDLGQVAAAQATQVNSTIGYDNSNRVVTMTDSASYNSFPPGWSTTPLATFVYSYDKANRVTSETDAEGTAYFHL